MTRWLACVSLTLAVALPSNAYAAAELQARAGLWSSNRRLDDASPVGHFALGARLRGELSDHVRYRADVFGGTELGAGEPKSYGLVREAFLAFETTRIDWRLGWQQHAWGRGDRVNPTDVLTPRDLRWLTPVEEETRFALPGLSADVRLTDDLRLIALGQRFQPGRSVNEAAEQALPRELRAARGEWGIKLDRTGSDVDWSLSYFSGMEKARNLVLSSCTTLQAAPIREHAAIRMLGADVASNIGAYGLRGEVARVDVSDGSPVVCGGRSSYTAAVIGLDRNLANETTLGVQLFARHYDENVDRRPSAPAAVTATLDAMHAANYQRRQTLPGFTLRMAQRLWNDRLDWEITGVMHFALGDYSLRPRVNYRLDDQMRVRLGADLNRGPLLSPFGLTRTNSTVFVEFVADMSL